MNWNYVHVANSAKPITKRLSSVLLVDTSTSPTKSKTYIRVTRVKFWSLKSYPTPLLCHTRGLLLLLATAYVTREYIVHCLNISQISDTFEVIVTDRYNCIHCMQYAIQCNFTKFSLDKVAISSKVLIFRSWCISLCTQLIQFKF